MHAISDRSCDFAVRIRNSSVSWKFVILACTSSTSATLEISGAWRNFLRELVRMRKYTYGPSRPRNLPHIVGSHSLALGCVLFLLPSWAPAALRLREHVLLDCDCGLIWLVQYHIVDDRVGCEARLAWT